MRFVDRTQAGSVLAEALADAVAIDDAVVLGVPRGGVIVAAEVADRLGLDLDLALARKLGAPGHPELAVGAIAEDEGIWLNDDLLDRLGGDRRWLDRTIEAERRELERRSERYRGDRPPRTVEGRTAIVVDDGVATGATLAAVLGAMRSRRPASLIAAVPVAPPDSVAMLQEWADQVVCPSTPRRFDAVGAWYDDFRQTTDEEVIAAMAGSTSS